jgi:hypothetical protein
LSNQPGFAARFWRITSCSDDRMPGHIVRLSGRFYERPRFLGQGLGGASDSGQPEGNQDQEPIFPAPLESCWQSGDASPQSKPFPEGASPAGRTRDRLSQPSASSPPTPNDRARRTNPTRHNRPEFRHAESTSPHPRGYRAGWRNTTGSRGGSEQPRNTSQPFTLSP